MRSSMTNGRKHNAMSNNGRPRGAPRVRGQFAYALIYVYIYIYAYIHIHIYMYMYIYIYIHTHTYIYIYEYLSIYLYMYIYIYIHMYTHTYMHRVYVFVFSPGAGLLQGLVHTINAKTFQGLGPKRRESSNGDRVYISKGIK